MIRFKQKTPICHSFEHRGVPDVGTIEFLIHASCEKCGWRCAIPGEGMPWPLCPRCNDDLLPRPQYADERAVDPLPLGRSRVESIVKPKRGKDSGTPPFVHAYIGVLMDEMEAWPGSTVFQGPVVVEIGPSDDRPFFLRWLPRKRGER